MNFRKRSAGGVVAFLAMLGVTAFALLAASAGAASQSPPRWSEPSQLAGVRFLTAVSCPSSTFCVAVGGGRAVTDRDGHWGRGRKIDANTSINSGLVTVSCVSATFCVAGDGRGNAFVYNGTSWSRPTQVSSIGLAQISCGSRTFCGALDLVGRRAMFFNGSAWSKPASIPGSSQPLSISCRPWGFCMALDGTSTGTWRLKGGHWFGSGSLNASNPVGGSEPNVGSAISCSGPRFCAALDNFGEAFTWSRGKWSRRFKFDPSLLDGVDAVSCTSWQACVVVDGDGITTRWNGQAWSPLRRIDIKAGLTDVSCATGSFCVAVDDRGRVLTYR
jgi:hypothetical protein